MSLLVSAADRCVDFPSCSLPNAAAAARLLASAALRRPPRPEWNHTKKGEGRNRWICADERRGEGRQKEAKDKGEGLGHRQVIEPAERESRRAPRAKRARNVMLRASWATPRGHFRGFYGVFGDICEVLGASLGPLGRVFWPPPRKPKMTPRTRTPEKRV